MECLATMIYPGESAETCLCIIDLLPPEVFLPTVFSVLSVPYTETSEVSVCGHREREGAQGSQRSSTGGSIENTEEQGTWKCRGKQGI